MDIKIRDMLPEDAGVVAALEKQMFGTGAGAETYKRLCMKKENIYMAAEDNGRVVAYCAITALYETADLCNIAVKEEYRRCNIAWRLLEKCIIRCKGAGAGRIMLEARESNIPALNLYKKMGFMEIGRRKGYYQKPCEDAIIMEKMI